MAFIPKWRKFTWVVVVINVLFLVWIIAGIASSSSSKDCAGLTGNDLSLCQSASAAGTGIGVGIIVVFWAFVDVILGVLWLVTRPRGVRTCPVCGNDVKRGVTVCKKCGYDFARGMVPGSTASPGVPPPPT